MKILTVKITNKKVTWACANQPEKNLFINKQKLSYNVRTLNSAADPEQGDLRSSLEAVNFQLNSQTVICF